MIEITPLEFLRDGYKAKVQAGDCIVWYKDEYPVEWVINRKTHYELHRDDGGDYSRIADVGAYEVCLHVEDTRDSNALRSRLKALATQIVDMADETELIGLRLIWQRQLKFMEYDRAFEERMHT